MINQALLVVSEVLRVVEVTLVMRSDLTVTVEIDFVDDMVFLVDCIEKLIDVNGVPDILVGLRSLRIFVNLGTSLCRVVVAWVGFDHGAKMVNALGELLN